MAFQDTKAEAGKEESGTKKRRGGGKGPKYRKGKAKPKDSVRVVGDVPVTTRPQVVVEKLDDGLKVVGKAKDSAAALEDWIEAVAKESGYEKGAVKALLMAKYNDKYEEKRRKIDQQAELFAEAEE